MSSPPTSPRARATNVTVGLLNGQLRGGRLLAFDPSVADLNLAAEIERGKAVRFLIPAETVAYVAFHRSPSDTKPVGEGSLLHVTLLDGQRLRVKATVPAGPAVGFFATPDDAASPFWEYFFYKSGVRRIERPEAIGALLVETGVVNAEQVARAVALQTGARQQKLGEILVEQLKVSSEAVSDAVERQARRGTRLGEILVDAGLVSETEVTSALDEQKQRRGRRLGEILVGMGALSEIDLAHTLAMKFHLPFEDLDRYPIDRSAASALPRSFIERHRVLPLAVNESTLTLALADPLAVDVLDAAMLQSRRRLREIVATPSQLERHVVAALEALGDAGGGAIEDILQEVNAMQPVAPPPPPPPAASGQGGRRPTPGEAVEGGGEHDGVVVRLVNQILLDAYRRGASDIHVEPNGADQPTRVRLRIDGDCVPYHELPGPVGVQVLSRLKILAGLDISERRRAQDGKLNIQAHDRVVELRIATIPTVNGNEDAVLRVLAASRPMPIETGGLNPRNLAELKSLVARPYGLLL